METIRAFIAIDIPPLAIKKIIKAQNQFKPLGLDANWIKPENIHLTLRFLGNITSRQIYEITPRLSEIADETHKFKIYMGHIGAFPNLNRPKVLWVGLKNSDRSLEILQKKIKKQIQTIGFKPNKKKITPHLTFARIKFLRTEESLKKKFNYFQTSAKMQLE